MNNYTDNGDTPSEDALLASTAILSLPASTTYAEAYRLLEEVAEKLRQARPDDIDSLIADFRLGMAAYRICADRLMVIRQELDLEIDA